MDFRLALLERHSSTEKATYTSSAILINQKYVLTTSIFMFGENNDEINEILEENDQCGTLHIVSKKLKNSSIQCLYKIKDIPGFVIKKLRLFGYFRSKNIKNTNVNTFRDWAIDDKTNSKDITDSLSLFLVFIIGQNDNGEEFTQILRQWWDLIKHENVQQTNEVLIVSAPFGNRNFYNSYTRGIVSNIIGRNECLILSDCPTTSGSEGAPAYKNNHHVPFGMVISSLSWFTGDSTGLTLLIDIRIILIELLNYFYDIERKFDSFKLHATIESCFIQIYSGTLWGTAIIIDASQGILITNSHVVQKDQVVLCRDNIKIPAKLLYKTPSSDEFDLAVIKCDPKILKQFNLQSVCKSKTSIDVGDVVYAVGFAIFPKETKYRPTVSKGVIFQCNKGMIRTTCCINPGMSGGGILNENGELIGIIVSNVKLQDSGAVFPRINMVIPFDIIANIIDRFLITNDIRILQELRTNDPKLVTVWKGIQGKL